MTDAKKGNTEATLMGLPEVGAPGTNSTQVMDETVPDPSITAPPGSLESTAPSLAPVPSPPVAPPARAPVTTAPPRTKTGGVRTADTLSDAPRSKSSGAVPKAPDTQPRRPSRVAVKAQTDETADIPTDPSRRKPLLSDASPMPGELPDPAASTDPGRNIPTAVTSPSTKPVGPKFEWSMPRVAGVTGGVCFLFILLWVFWPSGKSTPRPGRPEREDPVEDVSQKQPIAKPTPKQPVVAPVKPKADKPIFALDSKLHVIDPYAAHLEDQPVDPAHKYRLRIEKDDARLGTALARLDEKAGWGVVRKMASHAALQFGGAKALRMHCEPGSHFTEGQFFPLELTDMATKKSVPIKLNPALHCWDFEIMKVMELGEGVKRRIRVPTDSTVKLGEGVPVKVAYVLEALGEKKEWRTGVLNPGESVLAEGRSIRLAIIDPYAADNEGSVDLELLSGDTESSGLVTPSAASGAEFVPANRPRPATPETPPAPAPETPQE